MTTTGDDLAVRFVNTSYAVRGQPRDAIATVSALRVWLAANDLPAVVTADDLPAFLELRAGIRRLMGCVVTGDPPRKSDVAKVNAAAAGAPWWPELVLADGELGTSARSSAAPPAAGLGALARSAIEVVTLPRRERLRACQGPGCVQFFQETARHRAWCSSGCGNRARVARHYARSRERVEV
jgi:predicted RNA-binding Zn ribbon-like protein